MNIITRDVPPRSAWQLEQAGIHPLLAQLYAARGVQSQEELDDGLGKLLPPDTMRNTREAAVMLADAIECDNAHCVWWLITIATVPPPARWPCVACACWVLKRRATWCPTGWWMVTA